ncbi:MAG: ABC transporter ATP-binding protein, partial [Thermoplasmata archaeon]
MVSFYVETRNLTKKYRNLVAVDRLNLRIKKGEIYGLVGPNGAGKTTTIKILCGILRATSGEAYILGRRLPDKRVMERIGYMPQETALYRGLTVKQNIEFFGSLYGLEREMLREKVEVLL